MDKLPEKPLLTTKLFIPPLRPELVSRQRLLGQLKEGLKLKLTLVAAPAGYGKTTLINQCIHECKMPVCWITLDEEDNDPTRFWLYFISAVQTVHAEIGNNILGLLQSQQALPMDYITTTIVNDVSRVKEDFAIVLDDYHTIEAQSIHDSIKFLLNHLPPQAHLIISSRTDPPLPFSRMRVKNQLMEVRADDLRFILEEAKVFTNDIMNLGLSDEDVSTLESRTEGWIASLQLAVASLKGRENISAYISEFGASSRYLMDYLIEEVLDKQDEATRSFLLETSILDRFTAPLCKFVTGRMDSREKLERLDATNLFLVPLDDERKWYRYHHLFAELLRNQLLRSQKGSISELHLKASQWFEQEGLINEAIHHAFGANDFKQAADLIESASPAMIMKSHCLSVIKWVDKLPKKLLANRPLLCIYGARANQLAGQTDAVETLLQSAESAESNIKGNKSEESSADYTDIFGRVKIIRATQSLLGGDAIRTIELCQEALEYLPENELVGRAAIVGNIGIAYWLLGQLPSAKRYLEEANTLGQTSGHLYYSLFTMSYLGEIHRVHGHLHQAAEQYREAIKLGSQWGGDEYLPATGDAFVNLSRLLHEWNDINGARQQASLGVQLAARGGVIRTILIGQALLAWQNQFCGNTMAVTEALQQVEGIIPRSNPHTVIHALALKAHISLMQGDLNAANRWAASQEPKLNLYNTPDFWSELPYLVLVRIQLAQGNVDEIPDLLDNLAQNVEAEGRTGSLIEILALQSIAFQAQDNLEKALDTLERALTLAEPEGYIRTFIDEGEPMAKLLRLAESQGIAKKYVRKLLASFHIPTTGSGHQLKGSTAGGINIQSSMIEPLSERELEVLHLIIDGKSNREIADTLSIVEGTVKTHINNIYGKMGVQSRTQAIAKARELRLFQ